MPLNNRGFRYGDALFETIRVINGIPCFVEDHLKRLRKGATTLKMHINGSLQFNDFYNEIEELLKKNNIAKGGRIRITLFRDGGGLYAPSRNNISWVTEVKALDNNYYHLNDNGLVVDLYEEVRRTPSVLSEIKTTNCIPYVLSGIYKDENNLDDCLVLNNKGNIAEAISSNIFLYQNGSLYTPPISEGCMDGVMRKQIIRIATDELGLTVHEDPLAVGYLRRVDEVFLTNSINGIQWVSAFREKRFFNDTSRKLINSLNEETESNLVSAPQ